MGKDEEGARVLLRALSAAGARGRLSRRGFRAWRDRDDQGTEVAVIVQSEAEGAS
jgi:hypothetical protein